MSDLSAVINRYVGRPWNANGFDCWELVRAIYADAYQVYLPQLPGVDGGDARASSEAFESVRQAGDWVSVSNALDGDAVVMSRRIIPHHVGIWIAGKIAHCDQRSGVVVLSMQRMTALGWGGFSTYRHLSRIDQP